MNIKVEKGAAFGETKEKAVEALLEKLILRE